MGASLLTTPLVALYFGMFSLVSPLANLLTLWAVSWLFLGGLLVGTVCTLGLPGVAQMLAMPLLPLARYLLWAVDWLSRPALAALTLDSFYYVLWLGLAYGLVLLAALMPGKKRLWPPLAAGAGTLALALVLTKLTFQSGGFLAVVLDVGQGQSVLLRQGERLTLVDCGGDSQTDPGDVAANYLQSRGAAALDLLVVSHYHADHAGGVPQLLRRVEVRAIALPDVEEDDPLRAEILAAAQARDIPVWFIRENAVLDWGEAGKVALFAPLDDGGESNEIGLTVLASRGGDDVLLTGDMDSRTEERLLEIAQLPQVELLVAGHHGSGTSNGPALLEAVRPELAAISVGEGNSYGHPHPDTLERLEAAGAEIYRTDRDGTIEVRF